MKIHLEYTLCQIITWIQHPIDMIILIFQVYRYKHMVLEPSILSTNVPLSLLMYTVT